MANRARIILDGDVAMTGRLSRMSNEFPAHLEASLLKEGQRVRKRTNTQFIPVALGDLKNSGRVNVTRTGTTEILIVVEVTYGGEQAPYALVVHEHPSSLDPPTWRGKVIRFSPPGHGPKYLERSLRDEERSIPGRLVARVRRFIIARSK